MAARKGFMNVPVRLNRSLVRGYEEWARMAGVSPETVMAVVLARFALVLREARRAGLDVVKRRNKK